MVHRWKNESERGSSCSWSSRRKRRIRCLQSVAIVSTASNQWLEPTKIISQKAWKSFRSNLFPSAAFFLQNVHQVEPWHSTNHPSIYSPGKPLSVGDRLELNLFYTHSRTNAVTYLYLSWCFLLSQIACPNIYSWFQARAHCMLLPSALLMTPIPPLILGLSGTKICYSLYGRVYLRRLTATH